MFKKIGILTLLTVLIGAVQGLAVKTPVEGDVFPRITLEIPEDEAQRAYLGLESDSGTFGLEDVDADLVIVEMMSIYCPYCQREAPNVEKLYELIESKGLDDQIKMLAIAPGNSAFEVGTWYKKYQTPFPIFPDPEYTFHEILGRTGTPHFFVLKMTDGRAEVVYSKQGSLGFPETFLKPFEEMAKECRQ